MIRHLVAFALRVLVEGGGVNAASPCDVGQTSLHVEDAIAWYNPLGGTVVCGTQRITYTGVQTGGAGSLVGPGISPASAPTLALASGAGVETGLHDYAVTFGTASGESLPSPIAAITVGAIDPPASAPTAGTPASGTGPDPGSHDYAVTFVTASGETTGGPTVTKATTREVAPSTAPTPSASIGSGVDDGNHDYVQTFTTSVGETTPSAISSTVTAGQGPMPSDGSVYGYTSISGSGFFSTGNWFYAVTLVTASGETTVGPTFTAFISNPPNNTFNIGVNGSSRPGVTGRNLYRWTGSQWKLVGFLSGASSGTIVDDITTPNLGAVAPSSTTATQAYNTIDVGIAGGDSNVTGRKLYRRFNASGTFKLVATIANNSATSYSDTTLNASLGADAPSSNTAYLQRIPLSAIPLGGLLVTSRKLYRTVAGGSQLKLVATIPDNSTTTYTDTVTDASLGANVPTSNTATANQVSVSAIPIGSGTVTKRNLYRTVAGGSQLKLLHQIPDNSTATYTDTIADASLGANVPTSDTSGLTQPNGQVLSGSITLLAAGVGWASSTGGWAAIGNGQQAIRYTGYTGNTLTGIPASGIGAIVATISYNSTITAASALTGIPSSGAGSILYPILKGDPVNLLVQVDDTAAQATLSALLDPDNLLGGAAGIREEYIQDNRLGETEARARGTAELALFSQPQVSATYKCRDPLTKSGKNITINLPAPQSISTTLKIQKVTISNFSADGSYFPTYAVEASTVKFSFEDLLTRMRKSLNRNG